MLTMFEQNSFRMEVDALQDFCIPISNIFANTDPLKLLTIFNQQHHKGIGSSLRILHSHKNTSLRFLFLPLESLHLDVL